MFLSEWFRKSLKKENLPRRQKTNSLKFETLEHREMLSVTSILSGTYSDAIAGAGSKATMYLELESDDSRKWVTVALAVDSAEGSTLDPSKITVKYRNKDTDPYSDLPAQAILDQVDGETSSVIVIHVPAGTYEIQVGGDRSTTGAFTADVYVPGGTEDAPTSVPSYSPLLVQAGLQQVSRQWNSAMESLYRKQLGSVYSGALLKDHPELEVTGDGLFDSVDTAILGAVAASGKVTAELTKGEPQDDELTFSSASVEVKENDTSFGTGTAAITVSGGSTTNLNDYTVVLSDDYTISGGTGADLSGIELPELEEGEDYKFENGKFYFNPNGKFDFIPKGTTATLTLKFTATDKTDTDLKGEGTITVRIVGANDTPAVDQSQIDLTAESETIELDIWSRPWSETVDGETKAHSDEFEIVIEGSQIKIGSTVIANIDDADVGDTFQFATIGFPAGSVTFVDSTFILWKGTGADRKSIGEIRLSSDGKTLTYKSAGNRDDSIFAGMEDGALSEEFTFTFTVKDNQGIAANIAGGDERSESGAVSVDLQVRHVADPQFALTLTETGVTEAAIVAQSTTQATNSRIPLTAFFTLDYSDDEKQIYYKYQEFAITATDGDGGELEISEAIRESIREALILEGYGKTDGVIEFNRDYLSSEAAEFLNSLEEDAVIDVAIKIRVGNQEVETEYVDSPALHILLKRSTTLVLEDSELEVNQHNTQWVSSGEPVGISGGVEQKTQDFYDLVISGDYTVTYSSDDGNVVETPELVYGEHYRFEWVLNEETGEIGVVFSFNPDGRFDFLDVGQSATVRFAVDITDKINPGLTNTATWEVVVRGEEAIPAPTFADEMSQATDEDRVLQLQAEDVASSTNDQAELVFGKVRVDAENVRLIDGQTPGTDSRDGDYYVIERPASGSVTITLQSGSIITLDSDGKVTFDPTNRTASLDPYDEEDGEPVEGTFAEETFEVVVTDTSYPAAPVSTEYGEIVVTVKGVADGPETPTFKADDDIDLGTNENRVLSLQADDVAQGHSADPQLRFASVAVAIDDVETINDEEPTEEDENEAGTHYLIERPDSGTRRITFRSGSVVTISSTGEVQFDPGDREDDLDPYELDDEGEPVEGTFAHEKITVVVEDASLDSQADTAPKELTILVRGIDEDAPVPAPTIDKTTEFETDADEVLNIVADTVAGTTNENDPLLVFQSVSFAVDEVAKFNGEDLDPDAAVDGKYVFTRPESGYDTILLLSGAKISLFADGKIEIDPDTLAEELDPYDADAGEPDPDSYRDIVMTVVVADIGDPERVASSDPGALTVRIKGVVGEAEEGLVAEGGPFFVNAYASVEEMPETLQIVPTYKIDGLPATGYTFRATAIVGSNVEDGEYSDDNQGIFAVQEDGTITVDPARLAALHEMMEVLELDYRYIKIAILAEPVSDVSGNDEQPSGQSYSVDVPITIRAMYAPLVQTTTTLDATPWDSPEWELSKSTDHEVVMTIDVTDPNDYARGSEDWFGVSDTLAIVDWKYGNEFAGYSSRSEVEALRDDDSFMQSIYDGVAALLAAKGTAYDYSLIEAADADEDEDEYSWVFTFETDATSSLYDFVHQGDELHLHSQLVVADNDFGGRSTIDFTIIIG